MTSDLDVCEIDMDMHMQKSFPNASPFVWTESLLIAGILRPVKCECDTRMKHTSSEQTHKVTAGIRTLKSNKKGEEVESLMGKREREGEREREREEEREREGERENISGITLRQQRKPRYAEKPKSKE